MLLLSFLGHSRKKRRSLAFSSVQFSRVRLFATPWIAAHQASLSITNSRSSLTLTSIELVMPSSYLILCRPLSFLPPIPPSVSLFQALRKPKSKSNRGESTNSCWSDDLYCTYYWNSKFEVSYIMFPHLENWHMCLGLSDYEQLRFLGQWFSTFLVSRPLYSLKIEDFQKLLFK